MHARFACDGSNSVKRKDLLFASHPINESIGYYILQKVKILVENTICFQYDFLTQKNQVKGGKFLP